MSAPTLDGNAFTVRGCNGSEVMSGLDSDDLVGAIAFEYRGGTACVHLNRYGLGHSMKKIPLPRSRLKRWLIANDWLPATWALQVEYNGTCMATSAWSKAQAIKECKEWIDQRCARP